MFKKLLREAQFHGARWLAEKHFRYFWIIILLLLFGSAVIVIEVTIARYLSNPTFIVQRESVYHSLDFPSVHICPEILFIKPKINAFLKNNSLKIPPTLNVSYIEESLNQVSAFVSVDTFYNAQDLINMELFLNHNGLTVDMAIQRFTASCEETLIRCRWHGRLENCSELFRMELTGVGYCCVFNGRSLKRKRYTETLYKSSRTGFNSGLIVAVNQSQDPYNLDVTYKWISLQNSRTFVEPTNNGTPLNAGSELWAEFYIHNFQISEVARNLDVNLKKCRMNDEPMEYFPEYLRKYCLVECAMRRTLEKCGCVRNIHPLPKGARYCRAIEIPCATQVSEYSNECICLETCDVPLIASKLSSIQLVRLPGVNPIDSFYEGLDFRKVTIVRVFLASKKLRSNLQCSYYYNIDLFAQLGGVFNLFFGCSVLTLLELAALAAHGLHQLINTKSNKTEHEMKDCEKKVCERRERGKFVKTIS